MVTIYTDGSALGNPGPGGYGVVMESKAHKLRKEFSGGFRMTTNNRMELLAVIVALEKLRKPGTEALIHSDSAYVVNAIEKGWVFNWERTSYKGKKNSDLWKRLLPLYRRHKVKLKWVKAHVGIPENERCDQLAKAAAESDELKVDTVFETERAAKKA